MRGTKVLQCVAIAVLALCLVPAAGCKKSSSGSGSVQVVPLSLEGTWAATVTHSVVTNCTEAVNEEQFTMFITQIGNTISITSDAGYSARGTIDGTRVTFTYSFPDGPGTTTSTVTLDFVSLLGDPSFPDSFSGSADYVWNFGTETCSGQDTWAGARIIEPPVGKGLTGLWDLTLTSVSTTCGEAPETVTIPVNVVQTGDDVTISLPGVGDFDGFVFENDVDMSLFGEYEDPQFFVVASGLLQISTDGNSISGPVDYLYSDIDTPENDCTGVVNWQMDKIAAIP